MVTDLEGDDDEAYAVAVQKDGKIVVGGVSTVKEDDVFALARYTTSGKLDAGFGSGGKVLTDLGGEFDIVSEVAIQNDGKIVAAGTGGPIANSDFAVVRYTPAGKPDRSFGRGGRVLTDLGARGPDIANAVAVQKDGKIVVAGERLKNNDFALVRYTTKRDPRRASAPLERC